MSDSGKCSIVTDSPTKRPTKRPMDTTAYRYFINETEITPHPLYPPKFCNKLRQFRQFKASQP